MLINRKGIAVAVLAVALAAFGVWYAFGPSYLSNPVVTATVKQCRGKAPDRFCVGAWPGGHGRIESLPAGADVGDQVRVKAKDDSSATTVLTLTPLWWAIREAASTILVGVAVVLVVYLVRRRRRYVAENPDDLEKLKES
ncbi:MAG TPA: hypothetical protein VGN37_02105 [Actinocatenispora sp.]